jgi:hypothetical protein
VRVFFFFPAVGWKNKKTLIPTFSREREKGAR